jgi:hypothetical protein
MKATFEIPDDLFVEVKVEAARRHKKLKELVPDLVRAGLRAQQAAGPVSRRDSERWLEEWVRLGQAAVKDQPPGPAATEILAADRRRLDD